jgi:hydrogenase maturation factor
MRKRCTAIYCDEIDLLRPNTPFGQYVLIGKGPVMEIADGNADRSMAPLEA